MRLSQIDRREPMAESKPEVLFESRYLRLLRRGTWEFAQRVRATGVVIIAAATPEGKVLLVEQYRPPVNCRVIELPAGLAGDVAGAEDEELIEAARRELLEETGYEAATLRHVCDCTTSAGLTDETAAVFVAEGLVKVAAGGGDESEDITIHEVPLAEIDAWLEGKIAAGCLIGTPVYVGLYLLKNRLVPSRFVPRGDSPTDPGFDSR